MSSGLINRKQSGSEGVVEKDKYEETSTSSSDGPISSGANNKQENKQNQTTAVKQESTVKRYITLAYRVARISRIFWFKSFQENALTYAQLATVLILMFASSRMDVWQSYKFKDYLTALTNKDVEKFAEDLLFFVVILVSSIPISLITRRLETNILLNWRASTTSLFNLFYFNLI
eukprot:TRINITY_DN5362_c1_g1_i2.p1 TRINITY_DN5362_c1_g1~~TRINITY_DN5362_c1_g1_i2.p1  ORF type:complete len:175 (-),score=44.27 TRINITY_DN5362_c1_g1_i2:87-611(-)